MFNKIFSIIFQKKFIGLKKKRRDNESIFFEINLTTTKENINEFLKTLPKNYQLNFFDNFHSQISDPGAYVWVQHINLGVFAYSLHNHGWSSEWKQIEKSNLVDYIYRNREFTSEHFNIYPWKTKAELGKTIGKY